MKARGKIRLNRRVAVLLAAAGWLFCQGPAGAILDEAHSFAMEAALPHVQEGFTVREDYWSGEMKSGEMKIIKHQLFKGNEYWFWLGSSVDGALPVVKIYDGEGKLVHSEATQNPHMAAARVLPAKTGTYLILITVASGTVGEAVDWALAYGYR